MASLSSTSRELTKCRETVSESVIQDVAQNSGIASLKLKQMEAILAFLSGKDVFVALQTGYGKFALLPALFN